MYVFGAIMYCVLASGELQPWANDTPETEMEVKTSNGNIYNPPTNGHLPLELKEMEQDPEPKVTDPMLSDNGMYAPPATEQKV